MTDTPSHVLLLLLSTLFMTDMIVGQVLDDAPAFQIPFMAGPFDYSAFGGDNVREKQVGNCASIDADEPLVNAQYTSDAKCIRNGFECNIGWTEPGDWLEYTFESERDDFVVITTRVASNREGRLFRLEIFNDDDDDNDEPALLEHYAFGLGWQTFTDIVWSPVLIRAGQSKIVLTFLTGSMNFCSLSMWTFLEFPFNASAALDFSNYHDFSPNDHIGNCAGTGPVDAQLTTDQGCIDRGSVCNIGWTEPGEFVDYIFVVGGTTDYVDITVRVASLGKNQSILLTFKPDVEEADSFMVSETTFKAPGKGWQTFEDVLWLNVPSNAGGQHILRLTFLTGHVNLCSVSATESNVQVVGGGTFSVLQIPFETSALAYNKFVEHTPEQLGNCGEGPVDAEFTSDQTCIDRKSDCNIGWTEPGESLWYFIEGSLEREMFVNITVRVASLRSTKTFTLEMEQLGLHRTFNAPGLGWQFFKDYVWEDVLLPAGRYHVVVKFDTGGVNFCSMSVKET